LATLRFDGGDQAAVAFAPVAAARILGSLSLALLVRLEALTL
jgi:hypothetical protein